MTGLAAALERAQSLDIEELARDIERIGFECTRCGECCRGDEEEPHTATIFPDEIRNVRDRTGDAWRDIARPMPYGLAGEGGETFEWALQADGCGDCRFLEEESDGQASCGIYADRPAICRTYPFQVDVAGTTTPGGEVVERSGPVMAYPCEGLGRDISHERALELAAELKARTIADIQEARSLLEHYRPAEAAGGTIVHDSEGAKLPDGKRVRTEDRS